VWCNPPYGNITPWVEKGYKESLRGTTTVMLLPCRTETAWWHDYVVPYGEIRWIRKKVKFEGMKDTAPFPVTIVIFRRYQIDSYRFYREDGARGGKIAASRMTPEQRRERARAAVKVRWAKASL
jgi:DNA N-6-adenine-methyltransferase (Dam)